MRPYLLLPLVPLLVPVRTRRSTRQTALAGAVLVAVSLALLIAQPRLLSLEMPRNAAGNVFAPVMHAGAWMREGVTESFLAVFSGRRLREENEALRAELALLQADRAALMTRNAETSDTREMVESLPVSANRPVAARVLGPVPDGTSRRLWIDLGAEGRTEEGQTVVGARGIVGKVREVRGRHAIVQLLTDVESRWGGEVEMRSESGVVQGTGSRGTLFLDLDRTTTDIVPGDLVVTSGLKGSTIPAGLPIGTVKEVSLDDHGRRHAVLDPSEDGESLRHVLVLAEKQFSWEAPR